MTIVLETTGKREDLETVCLREFRREEDALEYCRANTKGGKYWKNAFIIYPDITYDTEDLAEDKHGNHLWGVD